VVFLLHEANRSGAPIALLRFVRWLRSRSDVSCEVLVARTGPLVDALAAHADVRVVDDRTGDGELLRREPTLVFANSVFSHPLAERLRLGRRGVPLLTYVHELQQGLAGLDVRVSSAGVHRYAAVSEGVARNLVAGHGIAPAAVDLCPPFLDAGRFRAVPAAAVARARRRLGGLGRRIVVGACGTLWPYKGPDLLIDLAAAHTRAAGRADVRFAWIGGDWRSAEGCTLARRVAAEGLDDIVTIVPEVADPRPYLRALDVFALTSREDPFPLVAVEAAALGKPIVCFGTGGAPELVRAAGGVVVPPFDVGAMADAVDQLARHPDRRAEVGERGAAYVDAELGIDAGGDRLIAAMRRAAATPRRDRVADGRYASGR
jgi:glycosyltransferase involved in cell wall biosynthesis